MAATAADAKAPPKLTRAVSRGLREAGILLRQGNNGEAIDAFFEKRPGNYKGR